MVTKVEALAAVQQARALLDQAEAELLKAEEFLNDIEEAGGEVNRDEWQHGFDWAGFVRDQFNAVQTTVEEQA